MNGSYIDSADDLPFMLNAYRSMRRSFFSRTLFACFLFLWLLAGLFRRFFLLS